MWFWSWFLDFKKRNFSMRLEFCSRLRWIRQGLGSFECWFRCVFLWDFSGWCSPFSIALIFKSESYFHKRFQKLKKCTLSCSGSWILPYITVMHLVTGRHIFNEHFTCKIGLSPKETGLIFSPRALKIFHMILHLKCHKTILLNSPPELIARLSTESTIKHNGPAGR